LAAGDVNTTDKKGWLRIGIAGAQTMMGEDYINIGRICLCSAVLLPLALPLALPLSDLFWSDPFTKWTNFLAWSGEPVQIDHSVGTGKPFIFLTCKSILPAPFAQKKEISLFPLYFILSRINASANAIVNAANPVQGQILLIAKSNKDTKEKVQNCFLPWEYLESDNAAKPKHDREDENTSDLGCPCLIGGILEDNHPEQRQRQDKDKAIPENVHRDAQLNISNTTSTLEHAMIS
jgi:hypothetical protein